MRNIKRSELLETIICNSTLHIGSVKMWCDAADQCCHSNRESRGFAQARRQASTCKDSLCLGFQDHRKNFLKKEYKIYQ